MVDCFAVSCLAREEAEPGTAGGGAEDDGGILNDEVGLDGGIAVNCSAAEPGAPGVDEAVLVVVVAVDEGTEIMDSCNMVTGCEEGAWWQ